MFRLYLLKAEKVLWCIKKTSGMERHMCLSNSWQPVKLSIPSISELRWRIGVEWQQCLLQSTFLNIDCFFAKSWTCSFTSPILIYMFSAYFIYVAFVFPQNSCLFIILNSQGSLRFTYMLCHFSSSSFLLETHFFLCELISFFSVSCFHHLNFWVPRFGWRFWGLRLKSTPCYEIFFIP